MSNKLSLIASCSSPFVKHESGSKKPGFDSLIALADFYDVSIDYLVGRSDDSGTILNPARLRGLFLFAFATIQLINRAGEDTCKA